MRSTCVAVIILLFSLTAFTQKNWSAYVFVAEECPISIYMTQPLQKVVQQFDQDVEFVMVFPRRNSTQERAEAFLTQHEIPEFAIKLDPDQQLTKKLEATITPEVVIVENESGNILYRGRISDAYKAPGRMKHGSRTNELQVVLTDITSGKSTPQPWPHAVGCYITFHQQ